MLNEKFLARLQSEFPSFYARVDEEARAESARLLSETNGDLARALARARLGGAARMWWPYVKGSVPFVHKDRAAMEGFTRLVLTVGHLVGHDPGGMVAAREHVTGVLRQALDIDRLKDVLAKRKDEETKAGAAAAGAGVIASASAFLAPLSTARSVWTGTRRALRWLPPQVKITVGVVAVAALASVPLVAGFSAGSKAESAARAAGTGPVIDVEAPRKTGARVRP